VVMDGDLQDPPEVLPEMVARWRAGAEVVYAVRRGRKEGWFLRLAYAFFYRLINWISEIELPLDSGDFSLMDRKVVDMLVSLPERNRYVRGLRAWVGFRQASLEYERSARHAGKAKYDFRGLLKLALDGIFAFSDAPLRVATNLGLIVTGLTAVLGIWYAIARLVGYQVVPGFATLAILVIFFGGVQLVTIGILGEYLGRVYTEVKGRPRYVLRGLHGVEPTPQRHGLPPESADSGG